MKPLFVLARLAAITVLASTLAACGQRGPLHMPDSKPPPKAKPSTATKQKTPAQPKASEPAKPDASALDKP